MDHPKLRPPVPQVPGHPEGSHRQALIKAMDIFEAAGMRITFEEKEQHGSRQTQQLGLLPEHMVTIEG